MNIRIDDRQKIITYIIIHENKIKIPFIKINICRILKRLTFYIPTFNRLQSRTTSRLCVASIRR